MIVYESELKHYGVKGMRWGHRKVQSVGSSLKRASKMAMDVNAGSYGTHAYRALRTSKRQAKKAAKYQERAYAAPIGSRKAIKNQYKADITRNTANANRKLMSDYNSITKEAMGYRSKQSYEKTVAKRLLLSNNTRLAYDLSRSKGASRGKSAVDAALKTYGLRATDYKKAKYNRVNNLAGENRQAKADYKQAMKDRRNIRNLANRKVV